MKLGKGTESSLGKSNRKSSQGYVDIKSLTVEQLDELIIRQANLLQNRTFLEKLPDRGEKILLFKTELELLRKKKQEEYDETCQLLHNLNLNDTNAEDIEWNKGKTNMCKKQLENDDDNAEDYQKNEDEKSKINPLELFATHSGTANGKIKKTVLSKSEISDNSTKDDRKPLYADKFCKKYDKVNNCKERFKPNRLKNNDKTVFEISAEQIKKKLGNKWEVTQATPPVSIYKNTVMITLSESLRLQKEQAKKLKEIEKKRATEKLLQNMSLKMGNKLPTSNTTEYRNSENIFEESVDDDDENEFGSDCNNKNDSMSFLLDEID